MSSRGSVTGEPTTQPTTKSEAPPVVDGFRVFHSDFIAYLYAPHGEFYDTNVKKLEQLTGLPRESIAYILLTLNSIYMIFGSWAEFVCNLIGLAYPGYVSVKAIRTEGTDDDTEWLIYWSVYATFALIDFFAVSICQYFPIYWLAKMTFLIYLYLPQTQGSKFFYHNVVNPLVTKIDQLLEPKPVKLEETKKE